MFRYILKNPQTQEEVILHLNSEQENDTNNFLTEEGIELEFVEKSELVEWFAEKYKQFGAILEFITDKSQEGTQFVKGFGGLGGILRYAVDFTEFED